MKPVAIEILMKGNLGRGLDDARRKAESLDSVLKRVGATVGIAFGTREAIEFARKIVDVRGEVESLQISFETLAGKTNGRKLFGDILEFSVNTPMMMQDLAKGAQTLLGFNVEAGKVMPILRQIGDISMGDAQKFNSLTLAFAQMSSTGKLMGQDLLQMINTGFNPLVVISEKTGKSMAALKKEMSEGRITVKMVEDAFASATAEGGRFHGMLEKQSKGVKGAMSNLQGAWEDMLNDIGEKSQDRMVDAINFTQEMVKNYEKVLDILAQIVVAYGSYKAALMLVVAAQKAWALGENIRLIMMYRKEMGLLTAAQQAFNRAALVNPYVAIGMAAAAAGVAVYKMATADKVAEAAQKKLDRTLEDADRLAKDHQQELEDLTRKATDEAASTDDRREAMQQLVDKYPAIIQKYIDEKGHLADIINLKREIARLDGEEKAGQLEEETRKAQKYLELYEKSRKGIRLTDGERKMMNQLADEVWDQQSFWTKTISGSRGKFTADYYKSQLPSLQKSSARTKTENMLREYNYSLEKMTDEQLERMSKNAQAVLKKIGDGNSVQKDIYTQDFLTKGDYGERLGVIASILDKRHPANATTDTDPKKLEKLRKEQREQAAKTIEEERRWQEEITRIRRDAADARRDAEIAAIEDDGARERAEQDEQHERRLRQIQDQADEMKKAVYEHNKDVWENTHKDSPYELTPEGKAYLEGIRLDPEQQAVIDAQTEKENAEYARLVHQRYLDEAQAMRDYLKEYGTLQQQKLAITEEYAEKIRKAEAAGNHTEVLRLTAERDRNIGSAKAQELARGIDFSQVVSGLGSIVDEIGKATYKRVSDYKLTDEYKNSTAETKQAIADLERQLIDAGYAGSVSPFNMKAWDDINRHAKEYDDAVKKLTTATERHTADVNALSKARLNLQEVYKGGNITEIAVAAANVKIAEDQANKSGEEQKQAKGAADAAGTQVTNDLVAVDKGLQDFNTILGNITSGTLKGFADGVAGVIGSIIGVDDAAKGLVGVLGKQAGGLIGAILTIIDALGEDPTKFIDDLFNKVAGVLEAVISQLPEIVMSIVKGAGNIVAGLGKGILGIFGDFFGADNHEEMLELQDKYNSLLDDSSRVLGRFTEELEKSYGVMAVQNAKGAEDIIRNNMETIMKGIDSVMWDRYGGGGSDYYHANKALNYYDSVTGEVGDLTKAGVVEFFKKYGLNMWDEPQGKYTWNELFNNGDPMKLAEAFKEMRDSGNDLWRIITTEMGANDGALKEWIEKLIDAYDQIGENEKVLYERLTTTTEENVFDDFLDSLFNLADGSEDVFEDIADNWQKMVNRMVVNNLVGEGFREKLKTWYENLVKANRDLVDTGDQDAYRRALEGLKDDYRKYVEEAQNEIEQLRGMDIIGSTESSGSGQTARRGGFAAMSQDQGTKLDGMFTAGLQHWSSMDKELGTATDRLGNALDHLRKIEENTEHCKKLDDIAEDISYIKKNGIKMK